MRSIKPLNAEALRRAKEVHSGSRLSCKSFTMEVVRRSPSVTLCCVEVVRRFEEPSVEMRVGFQRGDVRDY
ncbi:hypothetical protein Csa_016089 [Cucumis sativus]|uniref:Uncharacterized protein n=1 Tax=Cucumis sativus TaxID=3659 RepID=A0A0A0K6V8_CUCSA|nr:hypothetical protein Csa_016089 [Cucumis sativus]